jgi:hypothetical protein
MGQEGADEGKAKGMALPPLEKLPCMTRIAVIVKKQYNIESLLR